MIPEQESNIFGSTKKLLSEVRAGTNRQPLDSGVQVTSEQQN